MAKMKVDPTPEELKLKLKPSDQERLPKHEDTQAFADIVKESQGTLQGVQGCCYATVTCTFVTDMGRDAAYHNLKDPLEAHGAAIAEFEDAMLKGDKQRAALAALRATWLARECGLRRGDANHQWLQRTDAGERREFVIPE